MTPLQAMKQALEALEYYDFANGVPQRAAETLRTAIAEMEKVEPHSYLVEGEWMKTLWPPPFVHGGTHVVELYTHPQQQTVPEGWQWVPKELPDAVRQKMFLRGWNSVEDFYVAILSLLAAIPKLEDKP